MAEKPVNDNIYKVGTLIKAKDNPGMDLIIHSYLQRIYFCAELGNPHGKHLAYFEGELISPSSEPQPDPFMRVTDKKDSVSLI